jgi:hypothetical protein
MAEAVKAARDHASIAPDFIVNDVVATGTSIDTSAASTTALLGRAEDRRDVRGPVTSTIAATVRSNITSRRGSGKGQAQLEGRVFVLTSTLRIGSGFPLTAVEGVGEQLGQH